MYCCAAVDAARGPVDVRWYHKLVASTLCHIDLSFWCACCVVLCCVRTIVLSLMCHDDVAPFGCVPTFFVVRMASHAQVQVRWVVGVVAWFCLAYCVVTWCLATLWAACCGYGAMDDGAVLVWWCETP